MPLKYVLMYQLELDGSGLLLPYNSRYKLVEQPGEKGEWPRGEGRGGEEEGKGEQKSD